MAKRVDHLRRVTGVFYEGGRSMFRMQCGHVKPYSPRFGPPRKAFCGECAKVRPRALLEGRGG